MKLYLAGPMRGIELYNFPMFLGAAALLRMQGYGIVSPAENDIEQRYVVWDPDTKRIVLTRPIEDILSSDLVLIKYRCNGFALLPGWEHSDGVRRELEESRYETDGRGKRREKIGMRYFEFDPDTAGLNEITWKEVKRRLRGAR